MEENWQNMCDPDQPDFQRTQKNELEAVNKI